MGNKVDVILGEYRQDDASTALKLDQTNPETVSGGAPDFAYGIKINGELYVNELIYSTGLTNSDILTKFKEIGISRNKSIVADSAEPKSISEILRSGSDYDRYVISRDALFAELGWVALEERIQFLEQENKQREQEIDILRAELSNFIYNSNP
jgi:hypothetical protein